MANEDDERVDDKESPKAKGITVLPPVKEVKPTEDIPVTPTKANLMEDIAKLKSHVGELQAELRDGLFSVSKKIEELVLTQKASIQASNFQSDFLVEVNERGFNMEVRVTNMDKKLEGTEQQIRGNTRMNEIHQEVRQNTQEIKCRNLILNGVPEKKDEIALDVAMKYLKNIDPTLNKNAVESAYRMG